MPHIVRSSPGVLSKLLSGAGENFAVPNAWMQTAYGSGWPVAPVSAPKDVELPRAIDYPMSINSTITPRSGYGLMPFSALLEAYENVTEVKSPVSLIVRDLVGLVPHLVDGDGNPVKDHPYQWMTQSPDGKTPFGVWLTRLVKSTKVYDAPAVYLHRTQGKIDQMHYIDGSTLFVILDQFGNVPDPEPVEQYVQRIVSSGGTAGQNLPKNPDSTPSVASLTDFAALYNNRVQNGQSAPAKIPAYTQVIKGTPFSWWDASEIWYMPQSRRMNAPYGESFIESAWSWIMIIVNVTAFELGHYRTGNMPEGFVTMPQSAAANVDDLMVLEMAYNQRMAGNPTTERNRLRFFPDGAKYFATKKPDFPRDLYNQAWDNVLHAIGVLPSDFGQMPGAGLGGGGFKKQATSDSSRQSINPNREFVASIFNAVLEQDGVDDVHFALDYALEEIDPDKKRQSVFDGMAHGTLSLNDALGELNLTPIGSPTDKNNIANKHLIVAGQSIYVVEDMQVQNGMAIPTLPPGGGNAGGVPVSPETAMEQHGAEHTPQDVQTVIKLLRNVRETGTLDGNFISVPSRKVFAKADAVHDDGVMIAVFIPDDAAQRLRTITEGLGLPNDAELETPENMHVTLAYLPDGQAAEAQRDAILDSITSLGSNCPPLSGKIQGYGVFNGKDGVRVLYATLDEPQLPFLRTAVCKALDKIGLEYAKDHGFVPHITMAYFPDGFELPAGFEVPDIPVQIDDLSLAMGTDRTDVELMGTPGVITKADPADELDLWMNKVMHWGALRKFTPRTIPAHVSEFIRAELDFIGAKASKKLRKAVFTDAAYVMGKQAETTLAKDYDSIASAFQGEIGGLIDDSQGDDPISQQAFGSRYRSALRRSGLQMFRQGMEDQGVSPESLSAEQLKVFRDWQAEVSGHVGNLRQQAYSEDGISEASAAQRPDMWTNVSLRDVYYRGATTVAPDAPKIWQVGDTEHCATCLSRDGQVKTLSEWGDAGYPGSFDDLDCRGVNCQCELVDPPPDEEDQADKFDANQLRHTSGKWIKDGATGLYVRKVPLLNADLAATIQQHIDAHVEAHKDDDGESEGESEADDHES